MRALRERPMAMRLLAALPLASGAALVVHVFSGISLGLALLAAGVIVALAAAFLWARLPESARLEAKRRVAVGAVSGVLATLAYDGIRWLLVSVLHLTFYPFDVYPIFGYAIGGTQLSGGTAAAIGVLYHYTNGVMFAIAYTMLFGTAGWWAGILWALGLEALMLSIYPGWLHPKAFAEFISVSMLGHVAYGTTLGALSRSWLTSAAGLRGTLRRALMLARTRSGGSGE